MWSTSRPAVTAEWLCTSCGVTNRKLVPPATRETADRCMHCGLKHTVVPGETPTRWQARAA